MKNRMITATTLCAILLSNSINAEQKSLSTADVLSDSKVTINATVGFVESFTMMGESEKGQEKRKEIEGKRNLATGELQEESKKFEKAKNDYVSKSTTMSDSAREKEEKKLLKMERDIKNLVAEKEEELKMDMQIATESLAQDLEISVTKLAKNENIDIVFDKMTGRAIYVSDKFDFTDKAINEMNKTYKIELAQNKKTESSLKVADNKTATAKPAKIGA